MRRFVGHRSILLAAALVAVAASGAEPQPPVPTLELLCRLEITLGPILSTGVTASGERRVIPITSGKVTGSRLSGTVLNLGADWQWVRPDQSIVLDATYAFRTVDGALITIHNQGVRLVPPEVAARLKPGEVPRPEELYFRATPRFETGDERYLWLNNIITVCTGVRLPDKVRLDFYRVL